MDIFLRLKEYERPGQEFRMLKYIEKGIGKTDMSVFSGYFVALQVECIHKAVERSAASDQRLNVEILLEHTRGSRGEHNSRTMLLPLIQNFTDVVKVSLYHSPSLRGLLKLLLPERFNETVALTHLKVYLTDDTLIMSGCVISPGTTENSITQSTYHQL